MHRFAIGRGKGKVKGKGKGGCGGGHYTPRSRSPAPSYRVPQGSRRAQGRLRSAPSAPPWARLRPLLGESSGRRPRRPLPLLAAATPPLDPHAARASMHATRSDVACILLRTTSPSSRCVRPLRAGGVGIVPALPFHCSPSSILSSFVRHPRLGGPVLARPHRAGETGRELRGLRRVVGCAQRFGGPRGRLRCDGLPQ